MPGTDNKINELTRFISTTRVGQKLKVEVVRDGLVKNLDVKLLKSPSVKYTIRPAEKATPKQLLVRKKWLRG